MEKFKAPEESQDKLHFLDYWRVIRIRKAIIFTVFCIVLLSSAIFTNFMPEKFRSFARMDIQKDAPDIGTFESYSYSGMGFDPYWMQTQFEIIKSTAVLYPVIYDLNLQLKYGEKYGDGTEMKLDTTYKILSGSVSLSQTRNTSIIKVSATTYDPDLAAEIANKVVEKYKLFRTNKQKSATGRGLESLEGKVSEVQSEITQLEDLIAKIKKEQNIDDYSSSELDAFVLTEDPGTIQVLAREEATEKRVYLSSKRLYDQLLALKDQPRKLQEVVETVSPDVRLTQLLTDASVLETQLAGDRNRFTDDHPDVRRGEIMQESISSQIIRRIDGIVEGYRVRTDEAKQKWDSTTQELENYKEVMRMRNTKYAGYITAKRDLAREKKILDSLKLKIAQVQIDNSIERESEVYPIDPGIADTKPVSPSWPLNLILGGIIGFTIGVGLAFFIEYLDTSVKTIDDVERALQAPVLGVIPQNVGAIIEEGPDSPHAEAYRVLRTNLLFSRKDKNANTFSVVSGGAGEGKSTTLFNLATIFAQNNERVLVVDSDLRRPSIHKIMGISNSLGLTNYLLGQNPLEEVIQTTKIPTLDVLPSGKLPSSSMGILNSPQMKELVEILGKRYDYVFFDSPPIMGISDASVLASLVGHTVQVIQYRKYPQAMTIRAKQLVQKISNNLAGVVLNNINMSQDSDYYYYSGYYYDYYYSRNEDSNPDAKKNKGKNGKPAKLSSGSRSEKPGSVSEIKQKY